MAPGGGGMRSLADVILSKIREQQEGAGLETVPERAEDYVPRELDPKVREGRMAEMKNGWR